MAWNPVETIFIYNVCLCKVGKGIWLGEKTTDEPKIELVGGKIVRYIISITDECHVNEAAC